jgi:adenylate cyclase
MTLEIERKFLVANDSWKNSVVRSVRIRDGLIANNKGHKARVRIANDVATIALKSRRSGLARTEFEYVIPNSDAEEMLRIMCEGNVLDKARHFVSHAGNTWQVDVYEGLLDGVVLAEIGLIPRLAVRDLPPARCPIMHIFDLTRILRRGCRHEAGHGESVFVSVGITDADEKLTLPDWIGAEVTADPTYSQHGGGGSCAQA